MKYVFKFILFSVIPKYFNEVHDVYLPPNQKMYCGIYVATVSTLIICSTLVIVSMTFERFYSIIRPHKAASFNTVKRAKITILCITVFSILFHIPYYFITSNDDKMCVIYYTTVYLQMYYWMSFIIAYALPFISLLMMNSVIIHTLRQRSNLLVVRSEGQCQNEGQNTKLKQSERQIYIILLLVTFGFLVLTTPSYVWLLWVTFYQRSTPYYIASNHLFYQVSSKTIFTNNGINFFFYVMSGQNLGPI